MIRSFAYTIFFILALSGCSIGLSQNETESDGDLRDFLDLLVSSENVYLSQYKKYYGASAELELAFELNECASKNWSADSETCISFIRNRWNSPQSYHSLFFAWLKNKFSLTGKPYKVLSVRESNEGFKHAIHDVLIGKHRFRVFENLDPNVPTGILIGISTIDGNELMSYLVDI